MSLRRKLLMLIATAFLGSCVVIYQLDSQGDQDAEVWVSLGAGQAVSLSEVSLAEVPTRKPEPSLAPQPNQPDPAPSPVPPAELAELALSAQAQSERYPLRVEPPKLTNLPAILQSKKSTDELAMRTSTERQAVSSKNENLQTSVAPPQDRNGLAIPPIDTQKSPNPSEFKPSSSPILNPFFKATGKSGPISAQPSTTSSATGLQRQPAKPRVDTDFIPIQHIPGNFANARPVTEHSEAVVDFATAEQQASRVQQAIANDPSNSAFSTGLAAHATPSQTGTAPAGLPAVGLSAVGLPAVGLPAVGLPAVLQNAPNFVLAKQPQAGDHWKNETPVTDARAVLIEPMKDDFSPGPAQDCLPYSPEEQQQIYEGKTLNANQRPLLEVGRPWYQLGQFSPGSNRLGSHNPLEQQFIIFGDARSGFASNTQAGNSSTLSASQLNLNFDWKLTSTERLHMFVSPLTQGLDSTGFLFDEDRFQNNTNANIPFGYFEGDLGAMVGGLTNQTYPFDLPFAVGVLPMLFQNGVWMEDTMLGVAFTIPSRNSARFDISNMDVTFFAGFDKLVTDALPGDDSAGKVYGIASFLEAWNGYVEADYAFLEDRSFLDRSYHNFGLGYTRRFGRFVSNSTRAIVNLGQDPNGIDQTADGWLLLSENSLITAAPSTVVPYFNLFAGFDRPQSVARNGLAGGVLRNTGILFESDNLTRYPTLDASANNTYGAALGLNLLASDFSQQLVVETAFVGAMESDLGRNAVGNQYGLGARYQLPLTNAMIFRADLMYGFLESSEDSHGARVELRHKF